MPVGNIGEEADVGHPDLDVARVIDLAVGVVHLIYPGLIGPFDVEDYQALLAGCDVSVGANQIDTLGVEPAELQRPRDRSRLPAGSVTSITLTPSESQTNANRNWT